MDVIRDPELPLLEMEELMSAISGRIPAEVEQNICRLLTLYASNITSVLCQFPSQQIAAVIDSYAGELHRCHQHSCYFELTAIMSVAMHMELKSPFHHLSSRNSDPTSTPAPTDNPSPEDDGTADGIMVFWR